jgi:hypothetical protein
MRDLTGRPACVRVMRLATKDYLGYSHLPDCIKSVVFLFHAELRHIISNFIVDDGDHFWVCVLFVTV